MNKNKKFLLIAAIAMIIYTFPSFILWLMSGIGSISFIQIYNIVMYSLSFIGIGIFLGYSFNDKEINRGLEFAISIVFFLMNIVSGILGFVYFKKTSPYKKRELPNLEIMYNHKKIVYILAFLLSMALMFIVPIFVTNKIVGIALDITVLLMMLLLFYKDLIRDFKYFKEYFREYNGFVWKMFGISLAIMAVLSLSIRFYTGIDTATNQSNLMETFKIKPIFVIFLACIYAPLTEELLFRGIFRKIFNKKWLFIILCGVTFGALHVVDDFKTISELLYILVYSSLGIFLSSVYYKTNNLWTNIYFHFIQNTLAVLVMILLSLLGI